MNTSAMIIVAIALLLPCLVTNANVEVNCTNVKCEKRDCPGAYVPFGQCCLECPDCTDVSCEKKACIGAYVPERECCEICPDCSSVPCVNQTCAGAFVPAGECCEVCPDCSKEQCLEHHCHWAYVPPTYCCEVCPGCNYKDQYYHEDEIMYDGCNECRCIAGSLLCTEKECNDGCTHKGQNYNNREKFVEDDCKQCMCNNGVVHCTKACHHTNGVCPKADGAGSCEKLCLSDDRCKPHELCCSNGCGTECMKPVFTGKGQDCEYHEKQYGNGQRFRDQCNDCLCNDGLVMCTMKECSNCAAVLCTIPNCTNPAHGECCLTCEDCEIDGKTYKNGDKVPCEDRCNTCTCSKGNIISTRKRCPKRNCEKLIQLSNQCCPRCDRG